MARRFPVVVPMLADGLLHLTAVRLLAHHLDDENHLALLGGAIHKSKVEVKQLLAGWFPKASVSTSIRRVPSAVAPSADAGTTEGGGSPLFAGPGSGSENGPPPAAPGEPGHKAAAAPKAAAPRSPEKRKATIDPLSADSYALRLTARRATVERLRRAQQILSHAVPDGDVDEILYRALGALIEQEGRRKEAAARPGQQRKRSAAADDPASRTITADVEREVRRRDEDRCAFVSKDGRRCEERRFLELHHVKPWIAGGGRSAGNIALRCRAHNRYEWKAYVAPIRKAQDAMSPP